MTMTEPFETDTPRLVLSKCFSCPAWVRIDQNEAEGGIVNSESMGECHLEPPKVQMVPMANPLNPAQVSMQVVCVCPRVAASHFCMSHPDNDGVFLS